MNDSSRGRPEDAGAFGRLLRFWRGSVGISQEELAARTDVSARHISFLENGRSRPGRQMVGDLARQLGLPETDYSTLLAAAGFMPDPMRVDLADERLGWLRKSLLLTMRRLDPVAMSVFDPYGNVHAVNRGWLALHRRLLPESRLAPPLNSYRLAFAEDALRPLLVDWDVVACRLLLALQQEVLLSGDVEAGCLLDELLSYPRIPEGWQQSAAEIQHQHSFRIRLRMADGEVASFLNTIYTAGDTPFVSEPRLRVSLLLAEDDAVARELAKDLDVDPAGHPLLYY